MEMTNKQKAAILDQSCNGITFLEIVRRVRLPRAKVKKVLQENMKQKTPMLFN